MVILRKPRARKTGGGGGIIIGVQHTGSQDGSNGWQLRQVTASSPLQAATLDTAYFDEHPLFQFPEVVVNGNYFRSIPIAYWWRGNLPDVVDGTTPRWTMLMSTAPGTVNISGTSCTFAANPGAFKRSGSWLDRFLWGTYRAFNNSGAPGSQPGKTHWGNVSWQAFKDAAAGIGDGHHMVSLQEWHEILGRAVIEKKTFQLVPKANRQNAALCKYRGIEEFAFGGSLYYEWLDGARTNGENVVELWTEAGGPYSNTAKQIAFNAHILSIHSEGLFDYLFLPATVGSSSASMIPDYAYSSGGKIAVAVFGDGPDSGAFRLDFRYLPSDRFNFIGSRLGKW